MLIHYKNVMARGLMCAFDIRVSCRATATLAFVELAHITVSKVMTSDIRFDIRASSGFMFDRLYGQGEAK